MSNSLKTKPKPTFKLNFRTRQQIKLFFRIKSEEKH